MAMVCRGSGAVLWLVHGGAECCATEQGGPQQILARGCCGGQARSQEVLRAFKEGWPRSRIRVHKEGYRR